MGFAAVASRISAQLAQVAVFVLAARMLSAAEFGVYTLTLAVAIFLTRVSEAGSREFLMSCREDRSLFDQIATAALVSGAIAMCAGTLASAGMYKFLGMTLAGELLALFSVWVVFSTVSAVYAGLLVRQSRAELHSIFVMAGEGVGLLAALFGLASGWGIFALAFGKFCTQITYLVCAIAATKWIPRLRLHWVVVRELAEFSRYILATRMVAYFHTYAVTFVIGIFLGAASVGYYRVAERLGSSFAELMEEPSRLIAWVSLRRAVRDEHNETELKKNVGKEAAVFLPFLLALAAPIFIGLALVSENLVLLLLGEQWHPAAPITSILAIVYMLYIPNVLTEPLMSLTGQVRRLPFISLFNAVVAIIFILASVPFGTTGVAIGQLIAGLITVCVTIWLQSHYGGVAWKKVGANASIVIPALIAMVAGVIWVASFSMSPEIQLGTQILAGALIYSGVLGALYLCFFRNDPRFCVERQQGTQ
ncbi:oligosaccharide flippase family protein [Phyllobacterium zundukense]|uniref:Uncharacterized protein n=1 Tax=Phyllobacterium zundukense TaxID=1867719 RepID=A0A2N9VS32_9HYPH|nr:oligosaccharide flippase family protein [Phyllobacterium zundukense]ATU92724.1 hypothetical protein BLM14_14615 [Phyllobacterium zundukense]PIO42300.1 hypothetical protein B5P45_25075 [Phyllobacterium zundukense]